MNKNEDSVIDVSFIYMILLRALAVQQYDRLVEFDMSSNVFYT